MCERKPGQVWNPLRGPSAAPAALHGLYWRAVRDGRGWAKLAMGLRRWTDWIMSDSLQDRVLAAIGDHYELDREIGRGGMSVVYQARDVRLNRRVAVKVLPPELAYDAAIRLRFTREAQTSALLAHPHIVPIYDVGERDGLAYFVMAFVGGGNLATLLGREPRQSIEETRRVLREICDALAYAHLRGVIHRDIKPDNILLDADGGGGRAVVTDFGIARAMEAGARLTNTGIAVGTPAYMSPEQAVGEREIDGRSDLYALGVLGYQMLTGRVPFTAGNTMSLLLKHVNERPRPIAELRPDAPRPLRDAIERALMKDPEDRWPNAASFRDALAADAVSTWRAEQREPVRYASPSPEAGRRERLAERVRGEARAGSARRDETPAPASARGDIVMEPEHLAPLTPEQRFDLRLWHGRVNLMDRVKAIRWYVPWTIGGYILSVFGLVGLAESDGAAFPLILSPAVAFYMSLKLWRRGKSLRASGLTLRRVFFMPRAKWVIPAPVKPKDKELAKLAPREVLESPGGAAIRRAAEDRAAILDLLARMPKADRKLLPDVEPTVKALMERVTDLAKAMHRLDESLDISGAAQLDARIARIEAMTDTPEEQRHLTLLRRQRDSLRELVDRREELARQLESAGLALANLRLDLIKFRSSGLQSALSNVSTATQEARALSRDIGALLEAADEMRV